MTSTARYDRWGERAKRETDSPDLSAARELKWHFNIWVNCDFRLSTTWGCTVREPVN